jgi:hemerythrin-like domain-containing protein
MPVTIGKPPESDFTDPLGMLSDCHRRIERFLDTLIEITKQAQGAELNQQQRVALRVALRYFREAAPNHTRDEEESLFPRMRASGSERVRALLSRLDSLHEEHVAAAAGHAQVETLGERWLAEGCLSAQAVRRLTELLEQLLIVYQTHIRLEDTEIFPLAAEALEDAEIEALGREMAARRGITLKARSEREKEENHE